MAKGRAGGGSLHTWRTREKVGHQRSPSGRGVCHLLSCSAHRGAHHLRLARTRRVRHLRGWCAREKGKGATWAALLGSGEGTSDFAAPSVAFPQELLCPCESLAANFLVPARPSATAGGWEYVLQMSEFL